MPGQNRQRQQVIVPYAANNRENEDLSRGFLLRKLWLRLEAQLTVAAAANIPGNMSRGDAWALISRIDIRQGGVDTPKSFTGAELAWLNYYWFGVNPEQAVNLGDGATLNPTIDVSLCLPFEMFNSIRPVDTLFDTSIVSSLVIEITWASHLAINSAATGFTVAPTLTVYGDETFGITGPFAQWRIFPIDQTVTATTSRFQIPLPVNNAYRGFYIYATDAGLDDGTIINQIKLQAGTNVYFDLPTRVLREMYRQSTGLYRGFGGQLYDDLFIGDANDYAGNIFVDLIRQGFMTESLDTLGFSQLELEMDVTIGGGATVVTVLPMEIVPIRGAPQ